MKGIKVTLAVAASALLLAAPAMAFHDGGVAQCEACHTMHNSLGGTKYSTATNQLGLNTLAQYQAGPYLLQGATQSEACLNCHEGAVGGGKSISTVSGLADVTQSANGKIAQFGPGGDFRWLTVKGQNYGHSINAPDFYTGAANLTQAPGATGAAYPAASLACSSCHDPHGKYRRTSDTGGFATSGAPIYKSGSYGDVPTATTAVGSYRLLGGAGYAPKSVGSTYAFSAAPPVVVAPSTYNLSTAQLGGSVRVGYGSGMSEWCSNCHGKMHDSSYTSGATTQAEGFNVHPAGNGAKLTAAIAANYQTYVTTGVSSGTTATSYNELVPFETGSNDYSAMKLLAASASGGAAIPSAGQAGPDTNSNVMCLSCHRAHASGFSSMLRYANTEFVTTDNGSGTAVYSTTAATAADTQTAYYNRPATQFGAYQRMICNKCHAKD
jgi:hypothetical protein